MTHAHHTVRSIRYSTPDGFNFEGDPTDNPPITPQNVAARAKALMDNVQARGGQYRTSNILIPFGDDFRWVNSEVM